MRGSSRHSMLPPCTPPSRSPSAGRPSCATSTAPSRPSERRAGPTAPTTQALDRLWEAFERVQRYVETDAGTDLVRLAKDAFFRALFEGAGRSVVPESLRRVEHRMRVVRSASLATPGRPAEMLEELAAILAAATARDTQALTQACAEHLDREFASGVRVLSR